MKLKQKMEVVLDNEAFVHLKQRMSSPKAKDIAKYFDVSVETAKNFMAMQFIKAKAADKIVTVLGIPLESVLRAVYIRRGKDEVVYSVEQDWLEDDEDNRDLYCIEKFTGYTAPTKHFSGTRAEMQRNLMAMLKERF